MTQTTRQSRPERGVLRNMAVLASGAGIARLAGVLSIPLITRLYLPEHMGILAVFVAVTALLVPFATLGYSLALPLPRRDAQARNLAVACLGLLGGFSLLLSAVLAVLAAPLLDWLARPELQPWWWLLPLGVFGTGLYEILSRWATRAGAFRVIARTSVWQAACGALAKILLGLAGLKPLGLLIGQILSQSGGILSLAGLFRQGFEPRQLNRRHMRRLLLRYSDLPRYRLPSQCLLAFSVQAPLLFGAGLFGAETAGQLGLALMALALPVSLFGNTTGQAYYAEVARIGRKDPQRIRTLTRRLTGKLLLLATPPCLLLLLLGGWGFELVFGAQWRQAGDFASILALSLLAQFVSAPLVNVLTVFDRQRQFFQINLRRSLLVGAAFVTAHLLMLSAEHTLMLYTALLTLHYLWVARGVFGVLDAHAH